MLSFVSIVSSTLLISKSLSDEVEGDQKNYTTAYCNRSYEFVHECILVFFSQHITYQLLNLVNIKHDINQQVFKNVDIHYVKSEYFSLV